MMKRKRSVATDEEEELDFSINEGALDEEWLNHPRMYGIIAKQLADARHGPKGLDERKAALEIVKAEVADDIRNNPSKYGVKKVTDKAVEAAVIMSDEVKTAQKRVFRIQHRVAVLAAAIATMEHRKKALENIVTLYGQDYFSAPRAKGLAKEQMEEAEKRLLRTRGQRRKKKD